jgi:hypothetical protein
MTQSLLCTGTWLLGFRAGGGGLVSHIRTEGDRGAVGKNSNGHPQGWPLLSTHLSSCYLPARPAGLTAWFTRLRFVDV